MVYKLYIDELEKNGTNLLFNIPRSLKTLEKIRINREFNEDDLKVIQVLTHDGNKSGYISKDKLNQVNKFIKNIKETLKEKDKEKTYETGSLIRKETYFIEDIIKKYRYQLRLRATEINYAENEFYFYLPDELKKDIDNFSTKLHHDIDEMYRLKISERERELYYKILDIQQGMNINKLAKHLGVNYNYLWKFIEKFNRLCLVDTIGGKRNNKRDRIVFPSLGALDNREIRDGKEGIITGIISQNITPFLDWSNLKRFIRLYEFNSRIDKHIYVVTPFDLIRYGKRIIRSLGIFYEGDLEGQLENKFNIRFKYRRDEFADKDSLIAYLHQIDGVKEPLYDETNPRGKELFGKISHSPIIRIS